MEKKQGIDIPLNGSVEIYEPSAFSVQINRWGVEGSDECFVILVRDGNGAIVYRSEFKKAIEKNREMNMDVGEYRLEKSKDGLYDIKVSRWICWCPKFTVKGIKADADDFGEKDDIDCYCEDKPFHGCGNMTFTPKPATQKVLDKYGIDVDEYNEIASVLEEGLSFGYCGLCY